MALDGLWKDLFEFPVDIFVHRATEEIREEISSKGFKGAVLGASGGIDSLVAAALCVRAREKNHKWRVVGLQMIDSRVKGEIYNSELFRSLGVDLIRRDITSEAIRHEKRSGMPPRWVTLGLTRMVLYGLPGRIKRRLILDIRGGKAPRQVLSHFQLLIHLHRLRISRLREFTARSHLMSVICANLTERLLGYFVEGGIDDTLMGEYAPISGLYKSQVIAVARYLGIPEKVIRQQPSPGFGGVHDEDIIGPYEIADRVLLGVCAGFSDSEIAGALSRHPFSQKNQTMRWKKRKYDIQHVRFLKNLMELSGQKGRPGNRVPRHGLG